MKKKVLLISNTAGVIYKFKFELLEELIKKGYEVYLFAQNENENKYVEEIKSIGVNYIEVKMSRRGLNPLKDGKFFLKYLYNILKIKPDFIYTFTIKPNLYGSLIARILKIKSASTITGLGTAFQNDNLISKILKSFYKQSFKSSEGVFFENNDNLEFFINNKIIKKEKAILVPGSGVNLKKFYPMEKTRKDDKIVFLFIGRIMKEKGIEEFLGAAEEIIKKYKDTEFWILGNYEEEKYKVLIEKLEKEKIVKYLGGTNDVRMVIKECDFLIQPSYHEGLSNVILEASAMGKLVLASDIPGCKEAIFNNNFLFLSQNRESLIEKISQSYNYNFNYKNEMKNQQKKIINNFSRESVVIKNLKILEREIYNENCNYKS
ncbi:MAG: glycosyltransferase family 4 protein [Cetobacterium sp.]